MMKFFKYKPFILTAIVCLLPILLGIAVWDKLPDMIAIHFDINNNPDNFASKSFAVFGLPVLMVLLQFVCCIIFDINEYKYGERKKFERVVKWIIPILSVVLYTLTIGFALGWNIDIRVWVSLIVGIILLVMGNYLPKFGDIKPRKNIDPDKARKINRFIGYETVIMGLMFIISIFIPPVYSFACIFLLIPYAVIAIVYGIKVGKSK